MKSKKERIHVKIGRYKKYNSLFSRFEDEEIRSVEEYIKKMKANSCGGSNDALRLNIERCEKLAREVLKNAGLPFENNLYPLPDNPGHYVNITDYRLVGKDPTPEYHAAQAIHYASNLKHFLNIERDVNISDLRYAAHLSSQMMYNADCLIIHDLTLCFRIGQASTTSSTKYSPEEKIQWEKKASELFNDDEFMEGIKPSRSGKALIETVSEVFGANKASVKEHFKIVRIPQKFTK